MFDANVVQAILIVLTVVLALFALWRTYQGGGVITASTVVSAAKDATPIAKELMDIAQIAVQSAEQLKREGKLQTNDEALNYALSYINKWVPKEWRVDNKDIIAAINSAVLVASALTAQIRADKAQVE